ncbi:MAG: hypothetical protein M5R36_29695 [Deltaproteobacteria bacterium]|nr:hypothetical protein [Deltaproteobacteria bacterium]
MLRDETQRPRRVTPFLLSLTPSLFMAFWYAMDRAGAFVFRYEYGSALHWAWYKAGPFTFAGGFYPVTPEWTQWIVAAANLVLVPLFALLVLAILVKNFGRRASPFLAPALLLIALGLFGPTRFFEVVRPGERLLYIGVLVLLGTTPWTRLFTAFPRRLAGAAVAISLLNGAGAYHAGSVAAELVRTLNVFALPGEPVLMIADRHSGFRRAELEGDRARRPYSYPNWVFALKLTRRSGIWSKNPDPRRPSSPAASSGCVRGGCRASTASANSPTQRMPAPTELLSPPAPSTISTTSNAPPAEHSPRARWRAGDYFIAAAGP